MRRAARWLLWAQDKVPYYVTGQRRHGKLDTEADVGRLVDAKTAYAAMLAGKGRYRGLGFALGGGWYGIDFDHVRDGATGALPPWVSRIVEFGTKGGMYAEVSPSGTGLHLIGYWPEGSTFRNGRQHEQVEAYDRGRYFTMTGQRLNGTARLRQLDPAPTLVLVPKLVPNPTKDARQTAQIDAGAIPHGKVTSGWLADRPKVVAALADMTSDCSRQRWVTVGMALHEGSHGSADGLAHWEQWSAKAKGAVNADNEPRYVPGHCAEQWSSFGKTDGVRVKLGTLFHMAQEEREARPVEEAKLAGKRKFPGDLPEEFTLAELKRMKIPATRWLVDKLIAPGLTLLAAPPKAGKSYLALQMALCVASGRPFLDRETNASPVCYFDLEEEHELLLDRVGPIQKAHGINDEVPIKFKLTIPTGDEAVAALAEQIALGYKLLIVDIFARMRDEVNEDAKKNAYARDYKVIATIADFAMQHTGIAIIIIHHANKGTHDDWQAKISGSYGLAGGSHANIYMGRPDMRGSKSDDEKAEAIRFRILHAVGKRVPEQEVVVEQMHNMGGWQCSELRSGEILLSLKRREVIAFLQQRYPAYVSAKEVAASMGSTLKSVQQMMYLMGVKGLIESEGQGGAGYRAKRILPSRDMTP
jgi:hypothetical protein